MTDQSLIMMASSDILTRLRAVEERRPAIVVFAATLLAAGIVIGAILLQERETESSSQPRLTYQQCASAQDHANRLACYDDVTRQTFFLSVRNAR